MWMALFDSEQPYNLFLTDEEMEEMRAGMIKDVIKDRQKHPELTKKCKLIPEQAVDEIIFQYYQKMA